MKSNFRNLLNWVTAHINGTGDRHNAADIDYNSGTVEDGLITLSNAIETGLSELADADAENCKIYYSPKLRRRYIQNRERE